jgi:hypothetical protein
MSQPTTNEQQQYEELCTTEQRVRDEFVRTRDSGRASIDVIGQHHKAFNDAIQIRSNFKRCHPHVTEPMPVATTVRTNFQSFDYADVNKNQPFMPLRGQL